MNLKSNILKKTSRNFYVVFAEVLNQYNFKYQTVFSARFAKQEKNNQVLVETELFNDLNTIHNSPQTYIDNIDITSTLEHQIQNH